MGQTKESLGERKDHSGIVIPGRIWRCGFGRRKGGRKVGMNGVEGKRRDEEYQQKKKCASNVIRRHLINMLINIG